MGGVATLERLIVSSPPIEGVVLRYGHLCGPATGADAAGDIPSVHVDAAALAALLAIEKARPASTTSPNRTDISLRRRRGESWASTPAFGSTLTLDHRSPAESDALVTLATPNPVKGPAERGNDSAHKMPCIISFAPSFNSREGRAKRWPTRAPHDAVTSSLMQTGDLELVCAKCFGTRAWRWRCDMLTCQARN